MPHPVWVPVQVSAIPLPSQLPANVPGRAAEASPSAWAPAPLVGDLDEALDLWLWPTLPWVLQPSVNQQTEDLCL